MKHALLLWMCLAAVAAGAEPPAPLEGQAAGFRWDKLEAQLVAEAEAWSQALGEPAEPAALLQTMPVGPEAIDHVVEMVRKPRRSPISLHVADRLAERVLEAEPAPETARTLHAALQPLLRRERYRDVPRYSAAQLRPLEIGRFRKNATPQQRLHDAARVQELRDRKIARELPVKKHNEALYRLRLHTYRLALRADEPQRDQEVLAALTEALQERRLLCVKLAEAIEEAAPAMKPSRAKTLYEGLREVAQEHKYYVGPLVNPGEILLRPADNSQAHTLLKQTPGVPLVRAVNALAAVAGAEPMDEPTEQEVAAHQLLREAKAKLGSREPKDLFAGVNGLAEISKKYPDTPAARQAAELLENVKQQVGGVLLREGRRLMASSNQNVKKLGRQYVGWVAGHCGDSRLGEYARALLKRGRS